jgi:hypothetical protein
VKGKKTDRSSSLRKAMGLLEADSVASDSEDSEEDDHSHQADDDRNGQGV